MAYGTRYACGRSQRRLSVSDALGYIQAYRNDWHGSRPVATLLRVRHCRVLNVALAAAFLRGKFRV
jgi:hypothetical protein